MTPEVSIPRSFHRIISGTKKITLREILRSYFLVPRNTNNDSNNNNNYNSNNNNNNKTNNDTTNNNDSNNKNETIQISLRGSRGDTEIGVHVLANGNLIILDQNVKKNNNQNNNNGSNGKASK